MPHGDNEVWHGAFSIATCSTSTDLQRQLAIAVDMQTGLICPHMSQS